MILDFIYIFMFFLAILVGYKVGFLRYFLKIASMIAGFFTSLLLVLPVSKLVMSSKIGDEAYTFVLYKLKSTNVFSILGEEATISDILVELGLSKSVSNVIQTIASSMGFNNGSLIESFSYNISTIVVTVITFFVLWIGIALLFKILKLCADIIRTAKFVRIIDGVVGIVLSLVIYFITSFLIVATTFYLQKIEPIDNKIGGFMTDQKETSFGVYKYYYNENIFINFISLFSSN